MTKIAILSAIAVIVMLFEFPLWFAPSFYELDLSEFVVLIAGFALGPMAGVITEFMKIVLNLVINGTTTAFIGELSNFVTGLSFVLPATLIYKYKKTLSGAIIGMSVGTVSLAVVGSAMNYYLLIPTYARLMMGDKTYEETFNGIIAMGSLLNPNIDGLFTFVLYATAPFNLVKGVICSIITGLIYKPLSPILHKDFSRKRAKTS